MTDPNVVTFLGALTGAIGISIAIYLRWVCPSRVDPRWPLAFLVIGVTISLIATAPLVKIVGPLWIRGMAYTTLLIGEIVGFWSLLHDP